MHWPIAGQIYICPVCERKILVERGLSGKDTTIEMIVVCFECLSESAQKQSLARYSVALPIEQG